MEVKTRIKRASGQSPQINSDKQTEGLLKNTDSRSDLKMEREQKEQALTDTGRLNTGPGKIR